MAKLERHVVNGKVPLHTPFLVGFIKDLGFRRIILKCDSEPSTKSLADAVVQAGAGVEVVPQGLPEGDHMANGGVAMALREVERNCRTLQNSAEQHTWIRIADDSPLLSRLHRFASQVMNKVSDGKIVEKPTTLRRTE